MLTTSPLVRHNESMTRIYGSFRPRTNICLVVYCIFFSFGSFLFLQIMIVGDWQLKAVIFIKKLDIGI